MTSTEKQWETLQFGTPGSSSFRMIFLHSTHRHILSPWHDIPLYDPDCLFHCISAAPAGTWLPHDFAPEDYNPLRCAALIGSASLGSPDASGSLAGGGPGETEATSLVPRHFSRNCPWSLGLLPQTRQDPDDLCDELPDAAGEEQPIEVIEISGSEIDLGEVISVKPLAAFAVASATGKTFAWKVVAISGNCPVASVLESLEDVEASFPGSLSDIREWLRTRDVLQSNGRSTAGLPFVSEPLGPGHAHAVVARANATWQLFVDQNVPAEPWAPPPSALNGSFLEGIWKRKYMGDCVPSAAIPVSQPAHLQEQQAETAAQKTEASGPLAEEKSANGKWGGKLRGIFRTKSGRLMPSRLGGGSSDKCPIPKASTSHCNNSSGGSAGSGGGGGGAGGVGSGVGSLRSSGSSPESNLSRHQISPSGHPWNQAESGESKGSFGDSLRRATSLDASQLKPGVEKSSGLGGAGSGYGKPPVQHRRCESFDHYGSSKPKGLPKGGVYANSPSPCRKPPGLSPLKLAAEPRNGILRPSSSNESLESMGNHKRNDSGSSSHSQQAIEEEEEEEPPIHWRRCKSETVHRKSDPEDGEITLTRSNTAGRRVKFKEEVDVVMLADEDEDEGSGGLADDIFQLKFTLALALDNEGQVFPSPRKILFTNA
ncbi:hypothetical protein CLOM_g23214 [Closterium sp. NIES-68]|nr:hypothetical protein CLOM_g23214 [Closterium sp. NIES-68]GJP74604.1 hypothetical protein CLOP_g5164 [Closterium sp. NIES-67]